MVPENDISHKAYKLLVSDLKGKNNLDKGIFINDLYQRAKTINIIYNIQNYRKSDNPLMREYADALRDENKEIYNMYYEESKNPIWKYTGNSDTELVFLEIIKTEYDIVNNYHKSLNNILDESKTIENVSIFNSNDNVSLKSISKTADVYRSMLNTEVNYEVGKTVEKITSLNITDFFVLI